MLHTSPYNPTDNMPWFKIPYIVNNVRQLSLLSKVTVKLHIHRDLYHHIHHIPKNIQY